MIKLAVCFIIVNLAFANAFYGFTKQYEYPQSDMIISDEPYGFNKLAYAVCKGSDSERTCKIYQELVHKESDNKVLSCDLKLNSAHNVNIQNANPTHVVVTVKDDRKITLITLNMESCSVKETSIEADADRTVQIVPKGDSYDVVFKNDELCGEVYCIATFDLNGVNVMKAVPFGSFKSANTVFVKKADEGYLVGEGISNFMFSGYYVRESDYKYVSLSGAPFYNTQLYSGSTEEKKLGFCMPFKRQEGLSVVCQKFQAGGRYVITQAMSSSARRTYWESTSVLNLEKGMLVLMREAGKWPATIYVYGEKGNLVKTFEDVDLSCSDGHPTAKVFKNVDGDACITSICRDLSSPNQFSRTYKCLSKNELE